jgi:hypothetical protein
MRVQAFGIVGFVSLLGSGLGCSDPATAPGPVPPGQTNPPPAQTPAANARAALAKPCSFAIMPSSRAQVTAVRDYLGTLADTATLPLLGGEVTVAARADGTLAVTEMTLDLGNITLAPTTLPPDGLSLMGVKLSLRSEIDATADWRSDDDAANASVMTDLLLDWSVEAPGGSIQPLATQRISGVPLDLALVADATGRLTLSVHATRDGVFWTWSGLLELSDLQFDLDALDSD